MKAVLSSTVFSIVIFALSVLPSPVRADLPQPAAWWPFDETSGTVAADAVGSADGQLMNGAAWTNGGIYFDGVNDYVSVPDGTCDFSTGFTISLWVYPHSDNGVWARFADFGNGPYLDNIVFALYAWRSVIFECYTGSTRTISIYADSVDEDEQWQMYTVTVDSGGAAAIYKNGQLVKTGTLSAMPRVVSRPHNYIGKSNWSADPYFKGCMDDFRLYDRALSAEEVGALWVEPPAVTEVWVDDSYVPGGYNDGHTWAVDAFDNIPKALSVVDYGATVHVKEGTYYVNEESIVLKNGVKLIGAGAASTIIDGTPDRYAVIPYSIFRANHCDPNTVLEGFTIRNAGRNQFWQGSRGGALYNFYSHLKIQNCIFSNNAVYDGGGAIYNEYNYHLEFQMVITNCIFSGNHIMEYAYGNGGAIHGFPRGGVISNCTFTGNSVRGNGRGGGALYGISGTISNCTFTGNHADDYMGEGGAIAGVGSTGTVTDCMFNNNTAYSGGGAISWVNGLISNCTFEDNTAGMGGGASDISGTIEHCRFLNNTAQVGGAIAKASGTIFHSSFIDNSASPFVGGGIQISDASPIIQECLFENNTAGQGGGGIYSHDSDMQVLDCVFQSNSSTDDGGGGVYIDSYSQAVIQRCAFRDNTAWVVGGSAIYNAGTGGGIYVIGYSQPVIEDCIFIRNQASNSGGGIGVYDHCNPLLFNCSFYGNSTEGYGGGLSFKHGCLPEVANCILWENLAADFGHEIGIDSSYGYSSTPAIRYSVIAGCGGSGAGWDASLGTDGGGNLEADPLFVDPAGADGTLGTADDDLRLRPYSPCLNGGDPAGDYSGRTDLAGGPRVRYGRADMGAYEAFPIAGDVEPDEDVDLADFCGLASVWMDGCDEGGGWCDGADTDQDGSVDLTDLMNLVVHWLWGAGLE